MNLLKKHFHQKRVSSIFSTFQLYLKSYPFVKMVDLCPSIEVRGMKNVDRDKFAKIVCVPCINIKTESARTLTGILKKYLLKLQKFKPIRPIDTEAESLNTNIEAKSVDANSYKEICEKREVLLNPKLISDFDDISADDRKQLSKLGVDRRSFTKRSVQLTYDNWTADEIISAILPEGVETAASYSLVGHIVHLNLREHLLIYKYAIGEVLLDKIKQARTVVNKVDSIDNTFRVFNMEVLAGDADFITEVKENGFSYKFDFSAVYWNPRLCTEHERLVKKLKPGNVLYDVFAGVGPFSIPAAKRKCQVLANDLNPQSFKWLQHNAKVNKVESLIKSYNKDGADFIKGDVKNHILQHRGECNTHIVMNLPAIAVTFLRHFKHLFTMEELEHIKTLPMVHVYCFAKGVGDFKMMAQELVENELNSLISESIDEITFVRNVSPNKNMMRVSFQLTDNMILGAKRKLTSDQPDEAAEKSFKKSR